MEKKNTNINKKQLREKFLQMRNNISINQIKEASKIICSKIINHHQFKDAQNILVYIPFRKEVEIKELIEEAWRLGKGVLVPKTEKQHRQMSIYEITSWQDLELGNYGIYEPKVNDKMPFIIDNINLVIVPGVAFDAKGFRLGYGGGYYDRFFDRFKKQPFKIGVAFEMQMVEQLPVDEHDYPVDQIITEERNTTEQIRTQPF